MRRAMGGILPPEVQHRVKKGSMSMNFKTKLAEYDRPMLDRLMREHLPLLGDFVDTAGLRRDYECFLTEPRRTEQEALNLFLAANLAIWLRRSGLHD